MRIVAILEPDVSTSTVLTLPVKHVYLACTDKYKQKNFRCIVRWTLTRSPLSKCRILVLHAWGPFHAPASFHPPIAHGTKSAAQYSSIPWLVEHVQAFDNGFSGECRHQTD
jgi:hypothetical protein